MDGSGVTLLTIVGFFMFVVISRIAILSCHHTLDGIESKTVGDGQYGAARFVARQGTQRTFTHVEYLSEAQHRGDRLPETQGLVVGGVFKGKRVTALVDTDDVHTLIIGSVGIGKTAYFLYPNIECAYASGMSFLVADIKGDLFRNYTGTTKKYYGYKAVVTDLRNPTRSDDNNLLHLVNQYMDQYQEGAGNLAAKAKAEECAKVTSKTIINSSGRDTTSYGQNAYFYNAAEGLPTAAILLIVEYCPPERRHIVSIFKLIQDLLVPSGVKGKNQFQLLMDKPPPNHKAEWLAGSALNIGDQAMTSVISTALSRLNAFLDSELEQILCFGIVIDAERFCNTESVIFVVPPEENATKYFMASLIIQQLYREFLAITDEQGGELRNRMIFYLDEIGTVPKIESLEVAFSAVRSRRCSITAIIQSFAQLQKNYGKEGSEIIIDNCQDGIFGGFAPNSESAGMLSEHMGNRTVLPGYVSRGRNDLSRSLWMIAHPLMTPDEIRTLKKGTFIVTKTGAHPMQTTLELFLRWGITFEEPYELQKRATRRVSYADKLELEMGIMNRQLTVNLSAMEVMSEIETRYSERMFVRKEHGKSGTIGGKLPVRVDQRRVRGGIFP